MTSDLLFEIENGVAKVVFNRPESHNSLTFPMYERLAEICAQADEDRSIKAMILTGAGDKAFAAGTDIAQFRSFAGPDDALAYEARMDRVLGALENCRVPTIAAIAGVCTGGGAAIAACCDLRIGTVGARIGVPIARTLGNCLSMANYARLSALIGPARVKDMIFTARLIGAQEACEIGLLNEVLDGSKGLMDRAREIAQLVASHAPLTIEATKTALARLRDSPVGASGQDLILMCYMSQDFREGMTAFLEKRTPVWRGT